MSSQTIITEKMTFGGNCIAKIDGKTVFIPFALPDEKLEIEITDIHRDYDNAKILSVINPSPFRTKAPCKYYGICGGCNMQHVNTEKQTELRAEMLKECFERAGIKTPEIAVLHGNSFNYRSRFRLHDGGLEARSSNTVIPIDYCTVAEDCINEWLNAVPFEKRPKGKCHIFGSGRLCKSGGNSKVIIAQEDDEIDGNFQFRKKNKNIKQAKKRYSGTIISEENTVDLNLLGKNISFDVRGFFQSNMEMLEKTIGVICENLSGKNALDMYAGCGTFSVFLADIFENLTLVEHNRDALVFAAQNLSGKNVKISGLSGAKWALQNSTEPFDAAVIDPPRSGMEKDVLDYMCRTKIKDLRYLSCNPATHARDASSLVKAGYKLEKLLLLDFYPNTSHIESLGFYKYE